MYGRCASARPGSLRTSRATAWTWTSVRRTTGAVRRSATTNQAHTSVRSSGNLNSLKMNKLRISMGHIISFLNSFFFISWFRLCRFLFIISSAINLYTVACLYSCKTRSLKFCCLAGVFSCVGRTDESMCGQPSV